MALTGRKRKATILQLLTQLLQLDIRHLWNHSIIEEEFVRWVVIAPGMLAVRNEGSGVRDAFEMLHFMLQFCL